MEKNKITDGEKKVYAILYALPMFIYLLVSFANVYLALKIHPAYTFMVFSGTSDKAVAIERMIIPSLFASLLVLAFNVKKRTSRLAALSLVTFSALMPLIGSMLYSAFDLYAASCLVSALILGSNFALYLYLLNNIGKVRSMKPKKSDYFENRMNLNTVLTVVCMLGLIIFLGIEIYLFIVYPLIFLLAIFYLPIPLFALSSLVFVCNIKRRIISSPTALCMILYSIVPEIAGALLGFKLSFTVWCYGILSIFALITMIIFFVRDIFAFFRISETDEDKINTNTVQTED